MRMVGPAQLVAIFFVSIKKNVSTNGILICRETLLRALRFDSIYKCGAKWHVLVRGGRRFLRGAGWGDGKRGGGMYEE